MQRNENIKLSIIVPIYNVDTYLKQCIESILEQKYTNFELILVNDGSTDKSGQICDEFGARDARVKVFHKKNEGVSAARNYGVQHAVGTYIGFVDSDDWIYKDMYSEMMNIALYNDASIVCCNYDLFLKDKMIYRGEEGLKKYEKELAIQKLFNSKDYHFFPWNKIYKRELFDGVEYLYGKLYEDVIATYQLFKKIDKVYYLKKSEYVYRLRRNSITGTIYNSKSKELIEAIDYVLGDIKINYPSIQDKVIIGYIEYYRGFIDKAIFGNAPELKKYYHKFKKVIFKNWNYILKSDEISRRFKKEMLLCFFSRVLYKRWIFKNYDPNQGR